MDYSILLTFSSVGIRLTLVNVSDYSLERR